MPNAPRFAIFTKSDALWSMRKSQGNSIRQQGHLVNAKQLRAKDSAEYKTSYSLRRNSIDLNRRPGEPEADDPLEKVRRFLEKQGGLDQIEEFSTSRSPRKSSRAK